MNQRVKPGGDDLVLCRVESLRRAGRGLRGLLCRLLKRNGFRLNRHFALAHWLSIIFSENRFPLFGIML
jgi:hypothetical protein